MEEPKALIDSQANFKESRYRFVIISVYLLASLVNALPSSTFAPLVILVQKVFGASKIVVSLNYFVFPICSALLSPLVNWSLTKNGIRLSYYFASIFMITGVWLRVTLSRNNPYLCLLGSILGGTAHLFIVNSASKITMNWFRS